MKIDRIKVEGFGHFRQFELSLKAGLNVLYGPNEAGKSTLLSFIRAVLFGFEGRKDADRYDDESIGLFGGELQLTTEQGPLLVRRTGRKRVDGELVVRDGQGATLSDARLKQALFHVDKTLFREMFAFSLTELASIGALVEQKDVSAALFAAGTQGAQRLPSALKQLRDSTDGLYRPSGKTQVLNRTLAQLMDVRAQLEAVGDRPEAWFAARARLVALDAEERQLVSEVDVLTRAAAHQRRLLQVVDDVRALRAARAELASLPDRSAFPEGAVARLETLTQALQRAQAHRGEREEAAAACERAFKLASDDKLGEDGERSLRAAAEAFNARLAQYQALGGRRQSLKTRKDQLSVDLQSLGLTLSARQLLDADFTTAGRASISALKDRMAEADRQLSQLDDRHRASKARSDQIEQEVQRRTGEVDGLPRTPAATVRRAQAAVVRVGVLQESAAAARQGLHDRAAQRQSMEARVDVAPVNAVPRWSVPLAAAVLGLVCAMAYVTAQLQVFAVACAACCVLLGLLALIQRRATKMYERASEAHAARTAQHALELSRLMGDEQQLEARWRRLEEELAAAATEAGLKPSAAAAERDVRAETLAEELRCVERRVELSRELEALMPQLTAARRDQKTAHADRSVSEASRSQLQRELEKLCAPRGFPTELTADHALYLFSEAATVKGRLLELDAEEQGLMADERGCACVVEALQSAASECGLPAASPEALSAAAVALADRAKEGRRDRTRLSGEREALGVQLAQARSAEEEARGALSRLLSLAGCEDAEALRAADAQAVRYRELSRAVRERTLQVESAAGMPITQVEEELSRADAQAQLPATLQATESQLQRRTLQLKLLEQERGEKHSALRAWEQDDTLSQLRAEEELHLARASELVSRYAVERTALALLERARARFEKDAQPRVVQAASALFAGLTGDRYVRAFLPAERPGELWVNAADGQERAAAQLSRGTREQLYLAFRLAVIEDFARTRGPLPIVVDDILVNFDEQRTRNTLKVFARLAAGHQFIAFTHNQALRDAFAEHGANVVEVSRPRTQLFDVVKAS